jgi:hypothetical protein
MDLARKWRTFSADPAAVIEYKYVTPVRWRLRRALLGSRNRIGRKHLGDVVRVIEEFQSKRPGESFAPDWYDLWLLYNDVRTRKPKRVVEYGSGVSTVVLAHGLAENGEGRMVSLESEEHWATVNRTALPRNVPCELLYSPVKASQVDGIPVWRFSHKPFPDPDFIYLDGPPHVDDRIITADPLDLERVSYIVIDGRTVNKNFLVRRLPGARSRYRSLFSNDTVVYQD